MTLTEAQRERIRVAEEDLKQSLAAHEKAREIVMETGWIGYGQTNQRLEWIAHVERLQRDVIKYLSTCIDVLAEAAGTSKTMESFRKSMEQPAKDAVTHVLGKLDTRDAGVLREAIVKFADDRVGKYIGKAEGALPPAWLVATEAEVPLVDAGNAGSIGNITDRRKAKPELADQATRKRRREMIRQSPKAKGLKMEEIAERFGVSTSSIYGMVSGNRSKYAEQKRLSFLKDLSIDPEHW